MAPPPQFDDLGKEAKDLMSKNFFGGFVQLETKTKTKNGVDFTTVVRNDTANDKVTGSLETKYKFTRYGVTISEKWNTNNVMATTVCFDNENIAKGLKVDFDTSFTTTTGQQTAKLKASYKCCDFLHATTGVDFNSTGPGPVLHGSGVFAYKGWHAGYQASYDVSNSKLKANNVNVTYKDGDLVLHSGIIDASKYVGSIHHKVNPKLTASASLDWTAGSNASHITVAGRYVVGKNAFLKAKLDNNLMFGCSYIRKLRPGIQVTLSSLINAKSLEQGGHKLGLNIHFDT